MGWRAYAIVAGSEPAVSPPAPQITGAVATGAAGLAGSDLEYHDAAAALSDPPPQTDHYLAAAVQQ